MSDLAAMVAEMAPYVSAELDREERLASPRSHEEREAAIAAQQEIQRRKHMDWEAERERQEAESAARVASVVAALREAGIEMAVDGCGCCGSPRVRVAINGVVLVDEDNVSFDTRAAE